MAAERDSLKDVAEDVQERQVVVLTSQKQVIAVLQEGSQGLAERARELGGRVRSLTTMVAELRAVEATGTAVDTMWIDTTGVAVQQVSFAVDTLGVWVRGYTRTPPPTYQLSIDRQPIDIRIMLTQQKTGAWTTTVETPQPWVTLGSLDTFVQPRAPTWWDRNKFKVGLGLGAASMLLIVSAVSGG